MDFEQMLQALQSFIGAQVAVGITSVSEDGEEFHAAMVVGVLAQALEGVLTAPSSPAGDDGGVTFVLRDPNSSAEAGVVKVIPDLFLGAEWGDDPLGPLHVYQSGLKYHVFPHTPV